MEILRSSFMPVGDFSSMLILIPGILLSMWAQSKISSTYEQFSRIGNQRNITGAQVARYILDNAGLGSVDIEPVQGKLTDHYDPQKKILRLSEGVYDSTSVAALGIASHEVGHAIQDAQNYGPMRLRGAIVPLASLGGSVSMLLIMAGLFFSQGGGGSTLINLGVILFSTTVIFQLVTLPVEFDASKRALRILNTGILQPSELAGAQKVLSAAALTYVAAALMGILNLLRLLSLTRRRR